MFLHCIYSLHILNNVSDFLDSSQLYALVYICYTYFGGLPIISIVYVCHFERLSVLFFLKFDQRSTSDNIFALPIHRYGITKCALSEICSPFVHYMIFSDSCLEDKSSGKI